MWISKTDAERYGYQTHAEKAELWNGRAAMMGILFGAISYAFTGNLFFGLV